MILPLLLLLQSASPVQAPMQAEEEIIVVSRQLRMIKVDLKTDKHPGGVSLQRCRILRGSGQADLDAIPCDVAEQCVASGVPTRRELKACVEDRSTDRINAVLAARRAARMASAPG
ncbi:hypothetical protein [uncultured Sphingomonas sp.]|uniref:hypothetical protein n=1 Tax=uncultured Sphingomonas sp. TaxID=158754 RepID=UPI0025F2A582|nr:hypothetical protein [uncultured Sphingomonas sp.]